MKLLISALLISVSAHAQMLTWVRPKVCEKKSDAGECLNEIPDPTITTYRVYYKLVSEDPEVCADVLCPEIPQANSEDFSHNVELPHTTEKYDLATDHAFIRGALYDIRIAALANNIESLKNDSSVRTTIKGIPEAPHELDDTAAEPGGAAADKNGYGGRRTSNNNLGEQNEEINLGGTYSHGWLGIPTASASELRNGDVGREHDSGRKQRSGEGGSVLPLLGEKRAAAYFENRHRPTTSSIISSDRRSNSIQATQHEQTGMASGRRTLLRNDSSMAGQQRVSGVSAQRASLRSSETIEAEPTGKSKIRITYSTVIAALVMLICIFTFRRFA